MKTITEQTDIYEYSELSKEAKWRAAGWYIRYLLEWIPYEEMSEKMQKACDKADAMKTPWFTEEYIWEDCQEEIESSCEDHYWTKNGDNYGYKDSIDDEIKNAL